MKQQIKKIFNQFLLEGTFKNAEKYGSGHINDTFLIKTIEEQCPDYIFQKINKNVFKNIPAMLSNIDMVTKHIKNKLQENTGREVLQLIKSNTGENFVIDKNNDYWSASYFIENSYSYDIVSDENLAFEAGKAFGEFQKQLIDFPVNKLYITIPEFHNLEKRIEIFESAIKNGNSERVNQHPEIMEFIRERQQKMLELHYMSLNENLKQRVTHNDTKINNILFDKNNKALCIIDLGTVMPGIIHYDFGDSIRTLANTSFEDEKDIKKVDFNILYYKSFLNAYLKEVKAFITPEELKYLPLSPLFMTFIMGLRFFTDYLENDTYYKTKYEEHNLTRTKVQFRLLESMEGKYNEMENAVYQYVK